MAEMSPEQEELRKKLESMSPEELKEFQKKQCIFCHISSGKVQAKKVYEDSRVVAVLDINPANPGHVLLMPKEHYMIMPQMPDEELGYIFVMAKQLSNALLRALDVRGANIIVANGAAAGQRAQHFMLHIIPRKEGDGVQFTLPSGNFSEQELESIAIKVRKKLNELLGVKEYPTADEILHKKPERKETVKKIEAKPERKPIEAEFKPIDIAAIAETFKVPEMPTITTAKKSKRARKRRKRLETQIKEMKKTFETEFRQMKKSMETGIREMKKPVEVEIKTEEKKVVKKAERKKRGRTNRKSLAKAHSPKKKKVISTTKKTAEKKKEGKSASITSEKKTSTKSAEKSTPEKKTEKSDEKKADDKKATVDRKKKTATIPVKAEISLDDIAKVLHG